MVKESKLVNRGVSSAGFLVLHRTVMPSILVELGFITNSKDESLIASKEGQRKLAKGIFDGFSKYYEIYGKKTAKSCEEKPVRVKEEKPQTTENKPQSVAKNKPVFKLQIMASSTQLDAKDKRFQGEKTQCYKENGMYKYTIGESNSYTEIVELKKRLSGKFKESFIVAFLNGKKINTQEAVKLSQKNK